jgi:hypothetical protein
MTLGGRQQRGLMLRIRSHGRAVWPGVLCIRARRVTTAQGRETAGLRGATPIAPAGSCQCLLCIRGGAPESSSRRHRYAGSSRVGAEARIRLACRPSQAEMR